MNRMDVMAEALAARAVEVIRSYGASYVAGMSVAQQEALLPPDIVKAVNELPRDQQQYFVTLVVQASRKMTREQYGR